MSLKTESLQSQLKASAVNNEPFHQNWKLYKTSWWLLGVTKANGKTGITRHSMASVSVRVKFSLSTQACSGSKVPIILTTALHRVEWLKNLVKQWLGGWVGPQSRPRCFLEKRNMSCLPDSNLGPSSPQPSRYATPAPFSTSITSSKHFNKIAQSNMGIAGVPYRERCKVGLVVRHPEFAHRTWCTVPYIQSLLNSNKNY